MRQRWPWRSWGSCEQYMNWISNPLYTCDCKVGWAAGVLPLDQAIIINLFELFWIRAYSWNSVREKIAKMCRSCLLSHVSCLLSHVLEAFETEVRSAETKRLPFGGYEGNRDVLEGQLERKANEMRFYNFSDGIADPHKVRSAEHPKDTTFMKRLPTVWCRRGSDP